MHIWEIDTTHARAEFSARHLMVSVVRGGFENVSGTIHFDPDHPASASVQATIDATTIESGLLERDEHLRSADFLDVENYPVITFESTGVEVDGVGAGKVYGDLTIRGTKRPVVLDVEYLGPVETPFGDERIGVSATTRINREDFGLTWNMLMEAGGIAVSKEVSIAIDLEAIRVAETIPA